MKSPCFFTFQLLDPIPSSDLGSDLPPFESFCPKCSESLEESANNEASDKVQPGGARGTRSKGWNLQTPNYTRREQTQRDKRHLRLSAGFFQCFRRRSASSAEICASHWGDPLKGQDMQIQAEDTERTNHPQSEDIDL